MKSGQAVAVVLLIMAVVLTVGLSIVTRSTTDVSVSTVEEEAYRALEAAEAGVEKSLATGLSTGIISSTIPGSVSGSDPQFNAFVTPIPEAFAAPYHVPYALNNGDVTTLHLEGYTGNQIWLCWANGTGAMPAFELALYFRRAGEIGVGRIGLDPQLSGRSGFTNRSPQTNCGSASNEYRRMTIDLVPPSASDFGLVAGDEVLFLRVRTIHTSSPWNIRFRPVGAVNTLPDQAKRVISEGIAGQATQKVSAYVVRGDLPFMFDSAIFSGSSLTQ